jgi:hypothetical protein
LQAADGEPNRIAHEWICLPRIKHNKTTRVADEDPPEEYRGQAIFRRSQGVFLEFYWRSEGYVLNIE